MVTSRIVSDYSTIIRVRQGSYETLKEDPRVKSLPCYQRALKFILDCGNQKGMLDLRHISGTFLLGRDFKVASSSSRCCVGNK